MTKTSSTSSISASMASSTADTLGPSPYGTRSRNKAGNARPNYAEDREVDVESDWALAKKTQASGGAAPVGSTPMGDGDKSTGVSTRRSSNTGPTSTAAKAAAASTKDGIPGTSTFSLNDETLAASGPVVSKKRKAPGPGAATSTAAHHAGPTTSHGASRRAAATAAAARSRETNMLTFEHSQGFLQDGKLRADDGTILGINGKSGGDRLRGGKRSLVMHARID